MIPTVPYHIISVIYIYIYMYIKLGKCGGVLYIGTCVSR